MAKKMTKKMTKAEFFEVLHGAYLCESNFEQVLNLLAICYHWDAERQNLLYEKDGKEDRKAWAELSQETACKIHEALEARGYYDK